MPRPIPKFKSVRRTEKLPLETVNDFRELELYLKDVEQRLARATSGEPLNVVNNIFQEGSTIGKHAWTHQTSSTDPISPYAYTWKNTHVFQPSTDLIPITVKASSSQTQNLLEMYDVSDSKVVEVDEFGKMGLNSPAMNAVLNIKSTFSPDQIEGLVFWFRVEDLSDLSNITEVTSWPDASGNSRDATPPAGQDGPTYYTDGAGGGGAGPGSGPRTYFYDVLAPVDLLAIGGSAINLQEYSVIAVVQGPDNGENFHLLGGDANEFLMPMRYHATNSANSRGTISWMTGNEISAYTSGELDIDDFFVFSVTQTKDSATQATLASRKNAVDVSAGQPLTDSGGVVLPMRYIGGRSAGTSTYNSSNSYIKAILVYDRVLTASEVTSVENYLADNYSITGGSLGTGGGASDLTQWQDSSDNILSEVDTEGSFHIGGPDPARKLHVTDTAPQVRVAYDGSNYYETEVASDGKTTHTLTASSTDKFAWVVSGLELMTVKGGAGVGVNQTDPDGLLHIVSGASGATAHATADDVIFEGMGNTGWSILTPNTATAVIAFGDPDNNLAGVLKFDHPTDTFIWGFENNARMVLDSNGDITVTDQTASGDWTLTVARSPGNDSTIRWDETAVPNARFEFSNAIAVDDGEGIYLFRSSGEPAVVFGQDENTLYAQIRVDSNSDIRFTEGATPANEWMRISDGGRVGIQTATAWTPDGKLDIRNDITTIPALRIQAATAQDDPIVEIYSSTSSVRTVFDKHGYIGSEPTGDLYAPMTLRSYTNDDPGGGFPVPKPFFSFQAMTNVSAAGSASKSFITCYDQVGDVNDGTLGNVVAELSQGGVWFNGSISSGDSYLYETGTFTMTGSMTYDSSSDFTFENNPGFEDYAVFTEISAPAGVPVANTCWLYAINDDSGTGRAILAVKNDIQETSALGVLRTTQDPSGDSAPSFPMWRIYNRGAGVADQLFLSMKDSTDTWIWQFVSEPAS